MNHARTTKPPRKSPLYTSKSAQVRKMELIKEHGKDADGAYRTRNRADKRI